MCIFWVWAAIHSVLWLCTSLPAPSPKSCEPYAPAVLWALFLLASPFGSVPSCQSFGLCPCLPVLWALPPASPLGTVPSQQSFWLFPPPLVPWPLSSLPSSLGFLHLPQCYGICPQSLVLQSAPPPQSCDLCFPTSFAVSVSLLPSPAVS